MLQGGSQASQVDPKAKNPSPHSAQDFVAASSLRVPAHSRHSVEELQRRHQGLQGVQRFSLVGSRKKPWPQGWQVSESCLRCWPSTQAVQVVGEVHSRQLAGHALHLPSVEV